MKLKLIFFILLDDVPNQLTQRNKIPPKISVEEDLINNLTDINALSDKTYSKGI